MTTAKQSSTAGRTRSSNPPAETARALALQKLQETGIDPETVGLGEAEPMAMPTWGLPSNAQGKPSQKAQRNFTDPDSHVMKCGNGDFQGRCHSLAAIQAASIKCSARIGSVSSGGLLIHTSSGWRQQRVDRLQRLGWAWRAFS